MNAQRLNNYKIKLGWSRVSETTRYFIAADAIKAGTEALKWLEQEYEPGTYDYRILSLELMGEVILT